MLTKAPLAQIVLGLLALTVGSTVHAQYTPSTVTVSGTSWNPWLKADGTRMTDPVADQQTGQGADDFVGSATVAGFLQNAGILNHSITATADNRNSYIFRARMDKYDSKGFGGNWINGMDLDGDFDVDLFMRMKDGTIPVISFALPGTGTNTSPNTTSIITPWAGDINLNAATYNYQQVTTDAFNGTPDAYVSFGIDFASLQTAIRTYAGAAFANYVVDYTTRISFIASTSTQGNALNQDLYGTSGGTNSTSTWAVLGASTAFTTPLGVIPEPATYAQMGVLLMTAGFVAWRQRRKSVVAADAVSGS
jgi:hypothetical protein